MHSVSKARPYVKHHVERKTPRHKGKVRASLQSPAVQKRGAILTTTAATLIGVSVAKGCVKNFSKWYGGQTPSGRLKDVKYNTFLGYLYQKHVEKVPDNELDPQARFNQPKRAAALGKLVKSKLPDTAVALKTVHHTTNPLIITKAWRQISTKMHELSGDEEILASLKNGKPLSTKDAERVFELFEKMGIKKDSLFEEGKCFYGVESDAIYFMFSNDELKGLKDYIDNSYTDFINKTSTSLLLKILKDLEKDPRYIDDFAKKYNLTLSQTEELKKIMHSYHEQYQISVSAKNSTEKEKAEAKLIEIESKFEKLFNKQQLDTTEAIKWKDEYSNVESENIGRTEHEFVWKDKTGAISLFAIFLLGLAGLALYTLNEINKKNEEIKKAENILKDSEKYAEVNDELVNDVLSNTSDEALKNSLESACEDISSENKKYKEYVQDYKKFINSVKKNQIEITFEGLTKEIQEYNNKILECQINIRVLSEKTNELRHSVDELNRMEADLASRKPFISFVSNDKHVEFTEKAKKKKAQLIRKAENLDLSKIQTEVHERVRNIKGKHNERADMLVIPKTDTLEPLKSLYNEAKNKYKS